jgi:hypothetical protein
MKTYIIFLALLAAIIMPVPVFADEEPYVAVINEDTDIPHYYISEIQQQFLHAYTDYYSECTDFLPQGDPRISPDCVAVSNGNAYICPSACRELFTSASAIDQIEVCCDRSEMLCPAIKTSLTAAGNSGWYEWIIALPKKPEGELNIVIECGVLKKDSWHVFHYDAINHCAAETGEQVGPNCTRIAESLLSPGALPTIEAIAYPGCMNDFEPFHLTAYMNPGSYTQPRPLFYLNPVFRNLKNINPFQVLDGSVSSRIALKACMDKTIMVKWPVEGQLNELRETEANLEAGDLIKVRMEIPIRNTVDIYCHKYSVKIGGIGIPESLLNDDDCMCISDANCPL